jgi:hypothetical protein
MGIIHLIGMKKFMEIGDVFIKNLTGETVEIIGFTESQVTYETNEEKQQFQSSLDRFNSQHGAAN